MRRIPDEVMADLTSIVTETADVGRKLLAGSRSFAEITDAEVTIGSTPKDEVWRRDKVILYRYRPTTERKVAQPLLIAFSLVGRYSIVDLQEDRSIVRALLDRGIEVYVLDWGSASRADRWLTIDDYVNDYMAAAIAFIRQFDDCQAVNLLGICEGGTFSLCYAALHPETVKNLILVVTPIDFHGEDKDAPPGHGFINVWSRNIPPEDLDRFIEAQGNMPGEMMGQVFASATPMRTLLKYNMDLMELAEDKTKLTNFMRMEKWIADRPPHPGEVIKQWIKDFYQENRLVSGTLKLGRRTVDLRAAAMPILNLYARHDHVVPPAMTRGVGPKLGSQDYHEEGLPAGHMGILVSGKAAAMMGTTVSGWLSARQN